MCIKFQVSSLKTVEVTANTPQLDTLATYIRKMRVNMTMSTGDFVTAERVTGRINAKCCCLMGPGRFAARAERGCPPRGTFANLTSSSAP